MGGERSVGGGSGRWEVWGVGCGRCGRWEVVGGEGGGVGWEVWEV